MWIYIYIYIYTIHWWHLVSVGRDCPSHLRRGTLSPIPMTEAVTMCSRWEVIGPKWHMKQGPYHVVWHKRKEGTIRLSPWELQLGHTVQSIVEVKLKGSNAESIKAGDGAHKSPFKPRFWVKEKWVRIEKWTEGTQVDSQRGVGSNEQQTVGSDQRRAGRALALFKKYVFLLI